MQSLIVLNLLLVLYGIYILCIINVCSSNSTTVGYLMKTKAISLTLLECILQGKH